MRGLRASQALTVCRRLTHIARAGQTLLTRAAFDIAREHVRQLPFPGEGTVSQLRWRAHGRSLSAYLGRIDGVAAATGMLFDVRPVAGLGNGSVLRKFRGRGIQSAMIAHRMHAGWERGLRIFFGQTQNPASAHNLEDLGWRLLYTEIDWVRTT